MTNKNSKRRKAIIRRRFFIAGCLLCLAAVILAVAGVVSLFKTDDKTEKKDNTSSVTTDKKQEKEKDYSYSETPENVTLGEYTLDANYTRLLLVNGEHPLPEDYDYTGNLMTLDKKYYIGGNNQVDKGMFPYLKAMLEAAWKDGVKLYVWSPFRSYADQKMVFEREFNKFKKSGMSDADAETEVLKSITKPGTSEHHTGLCCDFNAADHSFTGSAMSDWMLKHAEDYGFILRYPAEKKDITKIEYESWHWRFVGINRAKEINKNGFCLEEFYNAAKVDNAKEITKK